MSRRVDARRRFCRFRTTGDPGGGPPRLSRPEPVPRKAVSSLMKTKTKPRIPSGRRGAKPADDNQNQATSDEFEREGMGVAPKE